ncbi:MAG: hypothetical protein HYU69_08150 [Bacteroidetes bacterium]|nr:hypothetical protein [Bacteroidota bacterium]
MESGQFNKENVKTAYDLLSDGFKGKPGILGVLSLGETRITLNKVENRILTKAIKNKDYYEIKRIVKKIHMK